MLKKPIKIRKFAMISMALIFWLSGVSLFAHSKQTNQTEPVKKQVPSAQPKVSLSNQGPKVVKQDESGMKRAAIEQQRIKEQAKEAKKQSLAKERSVEVKHSKTVQNTSAKAPVNEVQNPPAKNELNAENVKTSWAIKKAKIEANLKAKGTPQADIDKRIAAMEKQMNIKNKSNK